MQCGRDRTQPFRQAEIATQVLSLKPCAEIAVVVSRQIRFEVAAQKAAGEYTISRDRDTQGATCLHNLSFEPTFQKRVFDLDIYDRMDCCRAPYRFRGNLRQRNVADIAGLHQIGDGANRVFDRHCGIESGGPIDIDVVDAKTFQRISDEVSNCGWAIVKAVQSAVRVAITPGEIELARIP